MLIVRAQVHRLGLRLFHKLPPSGRSLIATLRGLALRSQRYGRNSHRLRAEAIERETWSRERWAAWCAERLREVLHRAATQVPYYREYWAAARARGDGRTWQELENWPILEKSHLRTDPSSFVADDCNPNGMLDEHTSGTTGTPLRLWRSRLTVQALYALSDVRERGWYGVSVNEPWAMLGGQLVAEVQQRRPPFWVWNSALNQLYMSSYHLEPALIPAYLDALARYRVTYLWGYTSSLYALAYEAVRAGRRDLVMKVAITNAEPLTPHQRAIIGEAFQCPVRETYGMAEMAFSASECEHGSLHSWPEVGALEVIEEGQPAPDGAPGDFVVTGLLNSDMPLIRYRTGDRGAMAPETTRCACGRTLPLLDRIEGRTDDLLYSVDGRRIGRLDPIFKADLPIVEAQVVQEALNRIRVRYVPAASLRAGDAGAIATRLRDRIGPVEVILEPVAAIPRTQRGKFRAVVCNLSAEERELVSRLTTP